MNDAVSGSFILNPKLSFVCQLVFFFPFALLVSFWDLHDYQLTY